MPWNKDENIKNSAVWLGRKIRLMEDKHTLLQRRDATLKATGIKAELRKVYRGGIYWVEFGNGNLGCEKNKTRPALIVSPNHINKG